MRVIFIASSLILPFVCSMQSASAATTISSEAYALSSTVRVANTAGVNIGPIVPTSGTASPGYSQTASLASLASTTDLGVVTAVVAGLGINTGLLGSGATANGTFAGDTTAGSANSSVNALSLSLFTRVLVPINTLSLGADLITSQTSVSRVGNIATLTGQSVFTNLNLELLSLLNFSLGANAQVTANTVLYNLLGLRIVLNEQISGGDGITSLSLATNAIHLAFNDYVLGGRTLRGDVIIGHSAASINLDQISPAPEPAVWLQFVAGFGLIGLGLRGRQKRPERASRVT